MWLLGVCSGSKRSALLQLLVALGPGCLVQLQPSSSGTEQPVTIRSASSALEPIQQQLQIDHCPPGRSVAALALCC
jgi:hypothetical protein